MLIQKCRGKTIILGSYADVARMKRGRWWLGRGMTRLMTWRLRCMSDVARDDTWQIVVGHGCD
jgi:hypothetical protein